jgi:hypothetical protein
MILSKGSATNDKELQICHRDCIGSHAYGVFQSFHTVTEAIFSTRYGSTLSIMGKDAWGRFETSNWACGSFYEYNIRTKKQSTACEASGRNL